MAVKGRGNGSRVRHISGPRLKELEETLESLTYKVEIIQIQMIGTDWYVHFYIPNTLDENLPIKRVLTEPTKTKKIRRK